MRVSLVLSSVVLTTVLIHAPAVATPAEAVKVAAAADVGPKLWLVGTPDQDFAERVANAVLANPQVADTAKVVLAGLEAKARSGQDVNLLGSPGAASADVDNIETAEVGVATAQKQAARGVRAPNLAAKSGPTDFELRGFAINSNRTWQVKTEIDGGFCGGDCEVTDAIKTTWKVTPQRNSDQFSYTSLYKPNAGNFKIIYADAFVYCTASSQCGVEFPGAEGAQDGSGSGETFVSHTSQAGRSTIDKIRMHASFIPNGTRYYDGVRTGTARCGSGSVYYCVF